MELGGMSFGREGNRRVSVARSKRRRYFDGSGRPRGDANRIGTTADIEIPLGIIEWITDTISRRCTMSTIESASKLLGAITRTGGPRFHAIAQALRHLYNWLLEGWYAAAEMEGKVRQAKTDTYAGMSRQGMRQF
jgi:hypothetical protein